MKYCVEELSSRALGQLKKYAESGSLSKLYLAVDSSLNIQKLLWQVKRGRVAGLLVVEPSLKVREVLEAPNLTRRVCALFFLNPSRDGMAICDFIEGGNCVHLDSVLSMDEARRWLLEKHPELKSCQDKYSFIYI